MSEGKLLESLAAFRSSLFLIVLDQFVPFNSSESGLFFGDPFVVVLQ